MRTYQHVVDWTKKIIAPIFSIHLASFFYNLLLCTFRASHPLKPDIYNEYKRHEDYGAEIM